MLARSVVNEQSCLTNYHTFVHHFSIRRIKSYYKEGEWQIMACALVKTAKESN